MSMGEMGGKRGEWERAGNSTSSMSVPHNAASAHGSLQGSILQDSFFSVGALPTKTPENRYALSSPVKAGNQRGPWRQPGETRLERPVLLASLGPVCHPLSPEDIKRGHPQPQKPISSWEVGTREPQEKVSRFPAPYLTQSLNRHLTDFT